ncbi:hypothetical protein FACS189426_07660 [Bacteroidia bacterium]|nr:hypothetical protein FACS189426_07660 [Bacteroidia bacterium]GHT84182.1 hypothetical protein FACS18947_1270 [Bacteroidia bacterium]
MKAKSLTLLLIFSVIFGISAVAQSTKENREIGSFRKISASEDSDTHIGNLTVAETTSISSSGSADCTIKNLKTNNCNLSSSGGSDLKIGLEVSGNLSISALDGSDINLSGKANQVSVSASGGSDVYIKNLTYNQLDSKKSGGSDIHK